MPGSSSGFVITETVGARFDLAMEFLKSGQTICFDGVGIRIAEDGAVEIAIESSWVPENITEAWALADLTRGPGVVEALVSAAPALSGASARCR